MTRLIGILLLISPLWAVSVDLIQEMQQARALMANMYQKAIQEKKDYGCNWHLYLNALKKDISPLLEHLQAFINHTPLLQTLQPKTPKQAKAIKALKAFEMLQLFKFLRASIPDIDCYQNSTLALKPFETEQNTQDFLKGLALIYAPLIEAYHQGLDITDYLQGLQNHLESPWLYPILRNSVLHQKYMLGYTYIKADSPPARAFLKDAQITNKTYKLVRGFGVYDHNLEEQNFLNTQNARLLGIEVQAINLWLDYYKAHALTFLGNYLNAEHSNMGDYWITIYNVYFDRAFPRDQLICTGSCVYIKDMTEAMQMILPNKPTPCLQPQYLNQEAKAVCLQIFQQHSYNPQPLHKYLKSLRLISIDESPCVYLNTSDTLQLFKSSNALCQALQTNLKKE
ncbi:hypothetical protein [Helicobacter bizzozeronii]|uniref:hypothetical protein n=1 Tax=Helicobacter bizzozeronii TaxID=56877 RepID=UPI001F2C46D1|nr:hypothetical protein [Helicobacter bizzozeronii]